MMIRVITQSLRRVGAPPVLDKVGDRDQLQVVVLREDGQLVEASHAAVVGR